MLASKISITTRCDLIEASSENNSTPYENMTELYENMMQSSENMSASSELIVPTSELNTSRSENHSVPHAKNTQTASYSDLTEK